MKRVGAFLLAFLLLLSYSIPVYACDEERSKTHVSEILFGDEMTSYASNENAKMLLNALYLCCEQSDNQGQTKIDFLKKQKVSKVPTIDKINVRHSSLMECAHIAWDSEFQSDKQIRINRKKVLQNTVNKVFGFGGLFGGNKDKSNSMAAMLYYSHILSDYLADDPGDTEINYKGENISSYCGQAFVEINGGQPTFSSYQKKSTKSYSTYSKLDGLGRSGVAFALLGKDTLSSSDSRQNIGNIKPSGWNQAKYPGLVNSDPAYIYNRCHLIAHQLDGNDGENNLITGTRYLNETGMKPFEDKVADYINKTGNHVLYRATPVFEGDNKLASGVQLEAYSVEDKGEGICFNVYCYNVQPGIDINYISGRNEKIDEMYEASAVIPFAIYNPSDDNPDLIYEMRKHLEILFAPKKGAKSSNYTALMNEIDSIASEARSLGKLGEKPAQTYLKMKNCEYRFFQTLKTYVPALLKNEKYYKSAFGK